MLKVLAITLAGWWAVGGATFTKSLRNSSSMPVTFVLAAEDAGTGRITTREATLRPHEGGRLSVQGDLLTNLFVEFRDGRGPHVAVASAAACGQFRTFRFTKDRTLVPGRE